MNHKFSKYLLYTLLISIGIGILMQLNSLERILDSVPEERPDPVRWHMMLLRLFLDSMVAWCTFLINFFVVRPFEGRAGFNTKKVILSIFITILSVYILSDLFFGIRSFIRHGTFNLGFDTAYFFKDLSVSTIILVGIYNIKVIFDRQKMALENEMLIRENLESRFESLRSQISPHFLFNSLSALRSLITSDSKKGVDYLDHLSDVLRKTLQNQQEKTVSVADELTLLKSYNFLLEMRYEDHLAVNIDVPDKYRHYKVPHLSLQTLVENAVKHNIISKRHHMKIDIFIRNECIVVRNSMNQKDTDELGTGFGLSNLVRQYELLGDDSIDISKTSEFFEVSLPMIK